MAKSSNEKLVDFITDWNSFAGRHFLTTEPEFSMDREYHF